MARAALALGLLLAVGGCARPIGDVVLATVNDEPITVQRLQDSFESSHRGHGVLLAGKGAVRDFLEKVVDKQLLVQEAKRIGIHQRPDIVKQGQDLRERRAADRYFQSEMARVKVSDDDVKAAWERTEARYQARQILVATREEADAAVARVKAGEDFGEVAAAISTAPTASRGGEMGIIRWGQIDPTIENRLWQLKKGEISAPFEVVDGWMILLAVERATVERAKLEQASRMVRSRLEERARRARTDELIRELIARAKGRVDEGPVVDALLGRGHPPATTTIVAEGAGASLTFADLQGRIDPEAVRKLSPARARLEVRWLLEAELFRVLLRREALARGYGERPEIAAEVEALIDRLTLDRFFDTVVLTKVEIGDADIDAYYRDHAKEFTDPEMIKLTATLVGSEEEAKAVMADLAAGKEFGAITRRTSIDPALTQTSGELGWISRGRLEPTVEQVAFALAPGESGIAKTEAGYFVVRVAERREPSLRPLAEVKDRARQGALRKRSQETLKVWVTKLREASVIEIDDKAIERAVTMYEDEVRKKAPAK